VDGHAIGKKAVGFARQGNASGLKRLAKQRRAAVRELDRVLSYASDCVDSEPVAIVPANPFVGKWIARPVYVRPRTGGYIDRSPRKLTIDGSNRMLLRIAREPSCIYAGYGVVPLTIRARGEVEADDTPIFSWPRAQVDCYPKGQGRVRVAEQSNPTFLAYSAPEDVLLMGASHECYWRKKGGSPKDCRTFWRGTPPESDDVAVPEEDAIVPNEEAAATPDEGEG